MLTQLNGVSVANITYGGREYYGGVDFYPENLEGGQKNFENSDITYCEVHHNIAGKTKTENTHSPSDDSNPAFADGVSGYGREIP